MLIYKYFEDEQPVTGKPNTLSYKCKKCKSFYSAHEEVSSNLLKHLKTNGHEDELAEYLRLYESSKPSTPATPNNTARKNLFADLSKKK